MSKYLSDQNQCVFTYESGTYGSASGTNHWIGMVQDHSPTDTTNNITIRYQGSTDRNVDTFADGNKDYEGTITYYPQDWKFLGFALGSISETASAGSHVFTENNSDDTIQTVTGQSLSSFQVEDSKNNGTAGKNFIRTYEGAMVDSYSINFPQGDLVSCEIGYKAQNVIPSSGAVTAVTPSTSKPYMSSNAIHKLIDGTTYDNVTDATFTISNNLELGHYNNGSQVVKELLPGNRDYEYTPTLWMDSDTAMDLYEKYYQGGSAFNSSVECVGPTGSLYLTMSGCKITDMAVPSPVEGVTEQTLTITPQHVSAIVHDSIADYNAW